MCADIYQVGIALHTEQLQRGTTLAKASLQQMAQAESQLERQTTQTSRALSTQAREASTSAARLRDQARAAREARDTKLADSLNAQARALSTQAREARTSATALRDQARASREAVQAARQQAAAQAAPGAATSLAQGFGGGGLLGGARAIGGTLEMSPGAVAGIAGAATALGLLGRQAATAATEMLNLQTRFTAATGSTTTGAREFQKVSDLAQRLGVDVTTLGESYAGFAAAVRGTTLEGDRGRQVFTALAEATSRMGLSNEQTQRAMIALQQVMSKGVLSAEELRGQMSEALPGALQITARALGVTTAELSKMLEQGTILSDVWAPKFAAQLRKEATTAVERLGSGATRLGNTFTELSVILAGPLVRGFDAATNAASRLLGNLFNLSGAWITEFEGAARRAGVAIADLGETTATERQRLLDLGATPYESEAQQAARQAQTLRGYALGGTGGDIPGGGPMVEDPGKKLSTALTTNIQDQTTALDNQGKVLQRSTLPALEKLKREQALLNKQIDETLDRLEKQESLFRTDPEFARATDRLIARREAIDADIQAIQDRASAEKKAATARQNAMEKRDRDAARQLERDQDLVASLQARFDAASRLETQYDRETGAVIRSDDAYQRWLITQKIVDEGLEKQALRLYDATRATERDAEATERSREALLRYADELADVEAIGFEGLGTAMQESGQLGFQGQHAAARIAALRAEGFTLGLPEVLTPLDTAMQALAASTSRWDKSLQDAALTLQVQMPEAVETFATLVEDKFSVIKDISEELTSSLLSGIQDLTRGGAFSFKKFADSVIQDLLRILQQKFLAPAMEKGLEQGIGIALKLAGMVANLFGGGAGAGLSLNMGAIQGGGSFLQSAVGGPVRRGLTLVGESGPKVLASSGGRGMIYPTSHPVTRLAVASAAGAVFASSGVAHRQYGGPLPSAVLGATGSEPSGGGMTSQSEGPGGTVNMTFNITTPDAASFVKSRGEIQRNMQNAFRNAQRS